MFWITELSSACGLVCFGTRVAEIWSFSMDTIWAVVILWVRCQTRKLSYIVCAVRMWRNLSLLDEINWGLKGDICRWVNTDACHLLWMKLVFGHPTKDIAPTIELARTLREGGRQRWDQQSFVPHYRTCKLQLCFHLWGRGSGTQDQHWWGRCRRWCPRGWKWSDA